jgi:hypothetical protein
MPVKSASDLKSNEDIVDNIAGEHAIQPLRLRDQKRSYIVGIFPDNKARPFEFFSRRYFHA